MIKNNNLIKYILKLRQHLPYVLGIWLIILFTYWGLWNSYFEQDEWYVFGEYNILLSLKGLEFLTNLLTSNFPFHFTPLSTIFKMSLYSIFSLNAAPYFIVSIFIHFLVSVSIYSLILIFTKKKFAAFLGALFFALNSSHHQAVTWIGTFEGVELSTLFGLLSLLSYQVYFKRKTFKFLLLTCGLLLVGLLFKETTLAFLLVLMLTIFFYQKTKQKIIGTISMVGVFAFYMLLRYSYLLFGIKATQISGIEPKDDLVLIFGYNFFSSIIKIFSQVIFPNDILVYFSNITTSPFDIYQHLARGPWVIENGFRYDLLTIPSGFLLIVLMIWISRKVKDRLYIFWGAGIIIFTIFPLLLLNKYLTYLDSRYFYPATVGISLIIGSLLALVVSARNKAVIIFGLIILFTLLSLHIFSLKDTINKYIKMGKIRELIVSQIVSSYPQLPKKAIFYTNSNSSFYGSPENERIMPFQSGFGHLLLVAYNPKERFAGEFFSDEFLWDLTDQGYAEFKGRGFGYFRDFDLMGKTLKDEGLQLDSVFSFNYNSKNNNLVDTTDKTRQRLVGFMAEKHEVEAREIRTDKNKKDIYWAYDGDYNTFWDSGLPIFLAQNITIDLGDVLKVTSISIDSQSSDDQNRNGYQVLISKDMQNWQEVFYEKLYPPKEGLLNIYFAPQQARFINIKQIGDHKYANWVINEIKIYRAINKDEDKI